MVERRPWLTALSHLVLIVGVLVVAFPLYLTLVASTHTAQDIVQAPMPVVSGVGHETDFTIADFCADLRAPTPTAAAELCAQPQAAWLGALDQLQAQLQNAVDRQLQSSQQRLDLAASALSRPSHRVTRQHATLGQCAQRLRHAVLSNLKQEALDLKALELDFPKKMTALIQTSRIQLERSELRLKLLDPTLVLQRGYAWLIDIQGRAVTSVRATELGQPLRATLADGQIDLTVSAPKLL